MREPTTTETSVTATNVEYRPTIEDVSHTHPDTDEAFGAAMAYKRGPTVAVDGGEREAVGEATETEPGSEPDDIAEADEEVDERMCDVEHTPSEGYDINHVYERGGEGRGGQ